MLDRHLAVGWHPSQFVVEAEPRVVPKTVAAGLGGRLAPKAVAGVELVDLVNPTPVVSKHPDLGLSGPLTNLQPVVGNPAEAEPQVVPKTVAGSQHWPNLVEPNRLESVHPLHPMPETQREAPEEEMLTHPMAKSGLDGSRSSPEWEHRFEGSE